MIVESIPIKVLVKVVFRFYAVSLIIGGTLPMVFAMLRAPRFDAARLLARFYATDTRWFETRLSKVQVLRSNDQDWARGQGHHRMRHGAQKQASDTRPAVRADNDKVGVQICCKLGDFPARGLASHVGHYVTEWSAPQASLGFLKRRELIGDDMFEALQRTLEHLRNRSL